MLSNWKNIIEKLCEYGEADRTFDNRIYYFVSAYMKAKKFKLPTLGIAFTDADLYGSEPIGYIDEDGIYVNLDDEGACNQYKNYIENQLKNL